MDQPNVFVPLAVLVAVRDSISERINTLEAHGNVSQYRAAVGYLTVKGCRYCGKLILEATPELAAQTSASPADFAHEWCHEIATLREALSKAEHRSTLAGTDISSGAPAEGGD